jgi:hypothetical protein
MVIRKHVTINANPELIWDIITDLRRAKEWAPGFEDYPYIAAEWPKAGATAIWRYHAGPMHFDFKLQLVKSERGRALQIANRSMFGDGMENYRFESDGGKTSIAYEASSRPNFLGRLFGAAMTRKLEKQMDETVANLKRYSEARAQ